jgi:SAM-dependent MidA family methyltransferase
VNIGDVHDGSPSGAQFFAACLDQKQWCLEIGADEVIPIRRPDLPQWRRVKCRRVVDQEIKATKKGLRVDCQLFDRREFQQIGFECAGAMRAQAVQFRLKTGHSRCRTVIMQQNAQAGCVQMPRDGGANPARGPRHQDDSVIVAFGHSILPSQRKARGFANAILMTQSSTGKYQVYAPDLPPPTPEARGISRQLVEAVAQGIRAQGGFISFADYMEMVLYEPGLGYYVNGTTKFGAAGDFVTAPGTSELFGATLARWLHPLLLDAPTGILELGAGQGQLAADFLNESAACRTLPERYRILEISPPLQALQQDWLQGHVTADARSVCEWLQGLPVGLGRTIFLANEVVDALPAEWFRWSSKGVVQFGVGLQGNELQIQERPAPAWLADAVGELEQRYGPWPEGYASEFRPVLKPWLNALYDVASTSLMVVFDYGHPGQEYYSAERNMGTLQGHYRHRVVHNPLYLPGLTDLTVSVDFTALAEAASASGFDVLAYAGQGEFLLGAGLSEIFAQKVAGMATETVRTLEFAQQVRYLTMPGEMGERFQVMILGKGLRMPSDTFRDRRERL